MAETGYGIRRMGRLAQALSEMGSFGEAESVLRRGLMMVEGRCTLSHPAQLRDDCVQLGKGGTLEETPRHP